MIYLILSILCTSVIYVLFTLFQRFKVDLFPAIIINYFTCVLVSPLFSDVNYSQYLSAIPRDLLLFSVLLGSCFIVNFYLMSSATQLLGVAGGTIVSRMSMIIPTAFGVFYLQEPFTVLKAFGITLALSAIYFTVGLQKNTYTKTNISNSKKMLWLPVTAFIGVGIVDTLLKISQVRFFGDRPDNNFVGLSYFFAFITGLLVITFFRRPDFKLLLKKKNLLWGFVLGIPNYFSVYLFFHALTTPNLHASTIFPVNSVGIVAISSVTAIIFLKESVNIYKIIGLLMAVAAIFLLGVF